MGIRGIKNRVFVQFWILFFLAMLFIDVLVMFFYLERSITRHTDQRRITLIVACENEISTTASGLYNNIPRQRVAVSSSDRFFFIMAGGSLSITDDTTIPKDDLKTAVYETLESGNPIARRIGSATARIFSQQQSVIITHPVKVNGQTVAAGGIQSSLATIYQDFVRIQKITVVFVFINSFFFALFGNRQLSRIYFRPLKRLAKRAETYQDEDPLFFSVRKEDNEFSVLSSSLNKMLNRIAEDKRTLKSSIDSLKAANLRFKQAQNDVIRAEKLATVGRLTSGIAHEIGNPIGIVLGYLDLLRQTDLSPEERSDFIYRSEKEITRINNIIRQLLDMSRSSAGESKSVSIHDVLQDLISVFNFQSAAEEILFETQFDATRDQVFADPDRLRQVFLNILLNAVDALNSSQNEKPRIRLATNNSANSSQSGGRGDITTITVSIQDNGPGISANHLAQVFDPFFTTKQPGKGTGLGLSVSFMIIEKLGGHISVSSHEEKGSIFDVMLPLTTPDPGKDSDLSTD